MALTIYDLAKEAGCSISTVSKAFSDSPTISDKTKERILKLADELGYKPNARARNFARQKSGTIIFATELYQNIAFDNPHVFEILTGIISALDKKGYCTVIKHIKREQAVAALRCIIQEKLVDGIIIHAELFSRELATFLSNTDAPCLVIGKPNFTCNISWVDINHELVGNIAASYLKEKGYKKILFHAGTVEDSLSINRLTGIRQVIKERQIDIIYSSNPYSSNTEALKDKIFSNNRPEIILCANNHISLGCLQWLKENGLQIPKDIALMTFDNYPYAELMHPALTAVGVDMFDMGKEAAYCLLKLMKRPNLHTQLFCTSPILLERDST